MSHYKTNLRDIEFNLFEVLGRDEVLGTGPFAEVDGETARSILAEVDRLSREDLAASYEDSDRNPPVFDPETHTAPLPESFKKSYQRLDGRRVLAAPDQRGARRHPGPVQRSTGRWRDGARRERARVDVRLRPGVRRRHRARNGNERDKRIASIMVERAVGRDHGAHRARRRLRRGRRPAQGHRQRRRLVEHRGRQAVHHLRRVRPAGEHHPPGAGPPGRRRGRRRSGHQGPEPVHRAQVPLRPRDRRADRRAQRRLRHQRRAQDGDQGLQHLRADLRRPGRRRRRAGQRLAPRRGAQGHRADVPGHRERPDDGRHQGDRHPVDRLPQRARLRQDPGAGRRPHRVRRQDRPARHDHPPPRRTPLADGPEVLRRGHARAGALHRLVAGPGAGLRARGQAEPTRPSWPRRSTTCCCRS